MIPVVDTGDASRNLETIRTWNRYHGILMLLSGIPFAAFRTIVPPVTVVLVSVAILIRLSWSELAVMKPFGGWANAVTAARMFVTAAVAVLSPYLGRVPTAVMLFITVVLDGLDGRLARKLNQETAFGNAFDRETDAFYVCTAGSLLYLQNLAPVWILVPAFLRYAYSFLLLVAGLDRKPERGTRIGPPIGVLLSATLAASFVIPPELSVYLLSAATALVLLSFGLSFTLLAGARQDRSAN